MKYIFCILTLVTLVNCTKTDNEGDNSCTSEVATIGTCVDTSTIDTAVVCTEDYAPVCGCDKITYNNECSASKAGVQSWVDGVCCPQIKPILAIEPCSMPPFCF